MLIVFYSPNIQGEIVMRERAVVIEPNDLSHEGTEEPLGIVVTEAGGITARLYALLRQTVPILEATESVSAACRQDLARSIRRELAGRN